MGPSPGAENYGLEVGPTLWVRPPGLRTMV